MTPQENLPLKVLKSVADTWRGDDFSQQISFVCLACIYRMYLGDLRFQAGLSCSKVG